MSDKMYKMIKKKDVKQKVKLFQPPKQFPIAKTVSPNKTSLNPNMIPKACSKSTTSFAKP